jgi:hypothetical protein
MRRLAQLALSDWLPGLGFRTCAEPGHGQKKGGRN